MTNVNSAFGFQPLFGAYGGVPSHELAPGVIAYNDTTKIFRGDPVKKLSTGFISAWTATTAVSQLAGIFWGVTYLSTSLGKVIENAYWPGADVASTAQNTIVAQIIPCTGAVPYRFKAQSDATGIAFADIGATVDVNMGGGGSIYTGWSSAYIDSTTLGTTATLPFRVDALYGGQLGAGGYGGIQPSTTNPYGGSATGAYNWVVVVANVTGGGATGI